MNRVRALLSTTAYRAPGLMLYGMGALFLTGSAAAAWSAWFYTEQKTSRQHQNTQSPDFLPRPAAL